MTFIADANGIYRSDGEETGAAAIAMDANWAAISTYIGAHTIGGEVQAWSANLDTWATVAPSENGQALVAAADYAAMKELLDLEIGTDVQAYDADLTAIAALDKTDSCFIVGNGTTWVLEDASTARTSLGLGTIATQAANSVDIDGGAIDGTTIGASSRSTGEFSYGAFGMEKASGYPLALKETDNTKGLLLYNTGSDYTHIYVNADGHGYTKTSGNCVMQAGTGATVALITGAGGNVDTTYGGLFRGYDVDDSNTLRWSINSADGAAWFGSLTLTTALAVAQGGTGATSAGDALTNLGAEASGAAASAVGTHESTYSHANYNTAYGWGDHGEAGYLTTVAVADLSDGTVTAAELNLLDLAGLTTGHVLRATGATTAAWGAIDVSTDTSPQLGGDLDANGNTIHFGSAENTQTPSDPATATIDLGAENHHTLNCGSAVGAITLTLTVPPGPTAGTIIVIQDDAAKDITWSPSSGDARWLGTEPTWGDDDNLIRVVSWRWDASNLYLSATDTFDNS